MYVISYIYNSMSDNKNNLLYSKAYHTDLSK